MRNAVFASAVALAAAAGAQAVVNHQATVYCDQFLPLNGQVDYTYSLNAGEITAFWTTPTTLLPLNFSTPDTIVELRSPSNALIVDNDDAGVDGVGPLTVGPTRGSAIRHLNQTAGDYTYRVRGFDALETGSYVATYVRFSPGGTRDFDDTEGNNTPATAQSLPLADEVALIGFGSLTAGDLDFYAINVNPGDIISALTIPTSNITANNFSAVDTRLDIRDSLGNILVSNDDAGTDAVGNDLSGGAVRGSVVRYQALTAGTIFVSVRGFDNTDAGNYALGVSLCSIPTPGGAALLLTALPLMARRRR